MISLEQAQAHILEPIEVLGSESVPLAEAWGRIPSEAVHASVHQPPHDNSAMDGYALRWDDVSALAEGGKPVDLRVVATVPAGGWFEGVVRADEAVRIMTGAPLPAGADTVVMQEWTEASEGGVRILRIGPGPGDNIRRAGEDIASGDPVVGSGRSLEAADLALLAAQGRREIQCHRRPEVAIISTGDEVHEPGDELPPGHIYSGNSRALEALVREAGGVPRYLGIARDDPDSLREVFSAVPGSDAVVSIGGVSVGDFDFVKEVLADLGGQQHFWKVAMRPGKPNACGTLGGIPYFGLPGNPVSCMVSFFQYVRPALLKMQGGVDLFLPTVTARLEHPLSSRARFLFLYRGICSFDAEAGGYSVCTTGPQGSGMMTSMARANCLISVPEDVEALEAGDCVVVQLLPRRMPVQGEPGLRAEVEP